MCCRLVSSDISCRKIQLITYLERGSLYHQLKEHYSAGPWMDICKSELNICSQTANRYIAFYQLVATYPRIIICDLSFETIMYCKAAIVEELERDKELGMRFNVQLREISIQANMNIEGDALPVFDYDVTSEDDKTNWDAAWDLSDRVLADAEEI